MLFKYSISQQIQDKPWIISCNYNKWKVWISYSYFPKISDYYTLLKNKKEANDLINNLFSLAFIEHITVFLHSYQ